MLDVKGRRQEIPNDFVWIFAGGTPPNDFLKKIGVGFRMRDLTLEASKEAKEGRSITQTVSARRDALALAAVRKGKLWSPPPGRS